MELATEQVHEHAHQPTCRPASTGIHADRCRPAADSLIQLFDLLVVTGLRLSKALALRWDAVDMNKRVAHVCRTVALGVVEERTKTRRDRFALLNERAIHALEFANIYADRRKLGTGKVTILPKSFRQLNITNT